MILDFILDVAIALTMYPVSLILWYVVIRQTLSHFFGRHAEMAFDDAVISLVTRAAGYFV